MKLINLHKNKIILPEDLIKQIPSDLIKKYEFIPIHRKDNTLTCVFGNIPNASIVNNIESITAWKIKVDFTAKGEIQRCLKELFPEPEHNPEPNPIIPSETNGYIYEVGSCDSRIGFRLSGYSSLPYEYPVLEGFRRTQKGLSNIKNKLQQKGFIVEPKKVTFLRFNGQVNILRNHNRNESYLLQCITTGDNQRYENITGRTIKETMKSKYAQIQAYLEATNYSKCLVITIKNIDAIDNEWHKEIVPEDKAFQKELKQRLNKIIQMIERGEIPSPKPQTDTECSYCEWRHHCAIGPNIKPPIIIKHIAELRNKINRYKDDYYSNGSTIPDKAYDFLKGELKLLEEKYSVLLMLDPYAQGEDVETSDSYSERLEAGFSMLREGDGDIEVI